MSGSRQYDSDPGALAGLIEEITAGVCENDGKFQAFLQAVEENVAVPCDAFVIGEPVSVIEFAYDGNERRGLTTRCRREDSSEHVVAVFDVVFPRNTSGVRFIAAYRQWLGLEPYPPQAAPGARRRHHKVTAEDLDLSGPVELAVLSVKERAARCRLLGGDRVISLRATRLWDAIPGEIIVVSPRKQWSYAGHPYLSGTIVSTRLDAAALGLVPLRLKERGVWDPRDHCWGEKKEPVEERVEPIFARGPRPAYEMEPVWPDTDPANPSALLINEANALMDAGHRGEAYKILMELCNADLRCLDAHAHLGMLAFDLLPKDAIRHYEAGLRIGELSLGGGFDGLLPWEYDDNRPFLRCMRGFGICLWRLGRFEEAGRIFDRMLWLDPTDNQNVRRFIGEIRKRRAWEERKEEI